MHRILLIDDHAIVREGFRRLLEEADGFEVVAEAGTPTEALASARLHAPDLALVDLSLGTESSGLVLLMQLHETFPKMRCVVLSMHDDPGLVVRALERGAQGYFSKAVAAEELLGGLRRVLAGERVLSSDLSPTAASAPASTLTARERETLRGLLSNLPPKVVAAALGISDKTLYRHRANLMEKLGARHPGELAHIARERGLLVDPD
ncbi:MAG: response regulator transcription factor [Rhizobium sp.]|nr:response regulator transcription factor [Rhizobium sp.]